MIKVGKIDHLVLRTTDVARLVRFYEEVLCCRVERTTSPATGLTQLRAGDGLIDIVAVDSKLGRAGGGPPGRTGNNLDHFCLELQDTSQSELRDWLASHGVECSGFETRYGAGGFGPSIYLTDPDGNIVELRPDKP